MDTIGLLCFGLEWESKRIRKSPVVRNGRWKVAVTGPGPIDVERVVPALIKGQNIRFLFSCGFAAGLNPELGPCTVICEGIDPGLLMKMNSVGARLGKIVSVSQPLYTLEAKRTLRESTGADAADMESQWLREVCEAEGITFGIVRVILDDARMSVLPILFDCIGENGNVRLAELVRWLVLHPIAWPRFLGFAVKAYRARAVLSNVLVKLIDDLR